MQKITPFLWFDKEAEEAANFYVSIFSERDGKSKITKTSYYGEEGKEITGQNPGTVMVVAFELNGQEFNALNGGPIFKLNGAISFVINCESQEEVDYFWEKLSEGGEKGQCGWINRDKYGVTWQIVPTILGELMTDPDPVKSGRVMKAMLQMTKIEIQPLKDAYEGK